MGIDEADKEKPPPPWPDGSESMDVEGNQIGSVKRPNLAPISFRDILINSDNSEVEKQWILMKTWGRMISRSYEVRTLLKCFFF